MMMSRVKTEGLHTVHFFWGGSRGLGLWNKVCIRSFIEHGYRVNIWSYEGVSIEGAITKDAEEVVESDLYYKYKDGSCGSLAEFSDIFRYKLLSQETGWYCDTDVICLTDSKDLVRGDVGGFDLVCGWQDEGTGVNNAVMYSEVGSVAKQCHEKCMSMLSEDYRGYKGWGYLGPVLLTEIALKNKCKVLVREKNAFYSVHYSEALDFIDGSKAEELKQRITGALFLHLWDGKLKSMGIPTDVWPPSDSYLGELFSRYKTSMESDSVPTLPETTAKIIIRYNRFYEYVARLMPGSFIGACRRLLVGR